MKKPLALVDLDGTLADFAGAMRRDLEALRSPGEPEVVDFDDRKQPPHLKARWDMIKRQPDWWYNLEYIPVGRWMMGVLKELGYKTQILSRAPRKLPMAWEQKVRWCMTHVPGVELTLTPTKYNYRGDVLVDDWPDYVLPWLKSNPQGIVILPDQPWNQELEESYGSGGLYRHIPGKNDEQIREILAMSRLPR